MNEVQAQSKYIEDLCGILDRAADGKLPDWMANMIDGPSNRDYTEQHRTSDIRFVAQQLRMRFCK